MMELSAPTVDSRMGGNVTGGWRMVGFPAIAKLVIGRFGQ
jgi:hypothetical protein